MGLCRGAAAWDCAWPRHGAAHARGVEVSRGEARGCARALRGAVQGRSVGLRRGAAAWGCAGAQHGAAHGRSMGLRKGAAWFCAGAQRQGAAQGRSGGLRRGAAWGCAGAQQRGAAQGRSVGPRMGAAWGHACARRGGKPGRSAGLRKSAAWGCAGAQGGAAVGRSVGLRTARGAECEGVAGAGVRLTTGFWRPRCTPSASPGTSTGHRAKGTRALGAGQWVGGRSATSCRHPTPALPGGGGGCLTTGSWHPTHVDRPPRTVVTCCRAGGGGGDASPQVLGIPCTPAAPHQQVVGSWAGGGGRPHQKVVGRAPQWGVDQVGEPAGTHARTPPGGEVTADLVNATGADAGPGRRPGQGVGGGRSTGQRRLFLTGPCQFMARGARGWVPTLAPGGSWSCCWGGGGGCGAVLLERGAFQGR